MEHEVREGVFEASGNAGIGIGTDTPSMTFHVGEGAASFASDVVGIGKKSPVIRFDVIENGTAVVK